MRHVHIEFYYVTNIDKKFLVLKNSLHRVFNTVAIDGNCDVDDQFIMIGEKASYTKFYILNFWSFVVLTV